MTDAKITEELVHKVSAEILAKEEAAKEEATKIANAEAEEETKQKNLDASIGDIKKQFEEDMQKMKDDYASQIKDRDTAMTTMKADLDRQMEQISLRKSVSVNDVKEEAPKQATVEDMTSDDKINKDKEFFRNMGIPIN